MSLSKDSRSKNTGFNWVCGKMAVSVIGGTKVKCRYTKNLMGGTFYQNLHAPLPLFCQFLTLWLDNVKFDAIRKQLGQGLTNMTLCRWSRKARQLILEFTLVKDVEKLGGIGKIVEIDESKFGKRKYNKGHAVEGQWVFGLIERESNRVIMVPVEKRDRQTLIPIIQQWVEPGTTIMSDCWKPYDCLKDLGYTHQTVNHSKNYVDPQTGACTNKIEASWRVAKASFGHSSRRKKFFASYLSRYMFLKNCRSLKVDPFVVLMRAAGDIFDPRVEAVVTRPANTDDDDDISEDLDIEEELLDITEETVTEEELMEEEEEI